MLPIADRLLPIAYCLLPIVLDSIAYYLLPIACCLLLVAMPIASCLLNIAFTRQRSLRRTALAVVFAKLSVLSQAVSSTSP